MVRLARRNCGAIRIGIFGWERVCYLVQFEARLWLNFVRRTSVVGTGYTYAKLRIRCWASKKSKNPAYSSIRGLLIRKHARELGMLPMYQRLRGGSMSTTRAMCNTQKKLSILLLFATLLFVFLCGPLYLFDHLFSAKNKESVPSEGFYPVKLILKEDSHILNAKMRDVILAGSGDGHSGGNGNQFEQ